jgi:hypothetical protein
MTTDRRVYRWGGVTHHGREVSGKATLQPSTMAAPVERYYKAGYRALLVVTGPGPVPPRRDDPHMAGGITKADGKRTWRAES